METYVEKKMLPYTPDQMFDLVAEKSWKAKETLSMYTRKLVWAFFIQAL